jgi:hypothetical protein
MQQLLKQRCSGTILAAISKDEFRQVALPLIDNIIQTQIAAKVQESFSMRHKSEELLNVAKRTVEIAVEQGEVTATEYLKEYQD